MYNELPIYLKSRVKEYLEMNQFCKAKSIHDAWMAERELIERRRINASQFV